MAYRLLLVLVAVAPLQASSIRHPAILNKTYEGKYQSEFTSQYDRVRLLVQQAQLEVSSQLGLLQYREGFRYPITIRFEDGAPAGLENALAYVRYAQSHEGFEQELVVNVEALINHPMNFDLVFYHEMTHAVLNDAVGGAATFRIPRWLQEGLAQYVSKEGPDRVERAARNVHRSQAYSLVFPLDGPPYANAYPQYYLAIKYLLDRHSINAVQALVRNLIAGQPIKEAIHDATGLTLAQYQKNVADYSLSTFRDLAIPDNVIRRP